MNGVLAIEVFCKRDFAVGFVSQFAKFGIVNGAAQGLGLKALQRDVLGCFLFQRKGLNLWRIGSPGSNAITFRG